MARKVHQQQQQQQKPGSSNVSATSKPNKQIYMSSCVAILNTSKWEN